MRNLNQIILYVLVIAIGFTSCSKDDTNIIAPVASGISANFGSSFANKSIQGISIEIKGVGNTNWYTATTAADGSVDFPSISPGVYNIKATIQFTKAQYENFFGVTTTEKTVNFSGAMDNVTINATQNQHTVVLKTSRIGNLLFKQIYYAGSDIKDGAGFRDFFFEVYNNSNEVLYADGLYFGQVYGRTTTSVRSYTIANGQYDWTKSIGQTKGAKSNTDYVYADHVYKIPGTGKQYPIQPGESIVVAATAINHKQPLTVGTKTYSVNKPGLTVDLSKASFEASLTQYLNSIGKRPLDTDIDNPTVPNLEIAYHTFARDMILDPLGRDSYVIFKTNDFASLDKLPNPQATKVTATTRRYLQIPNSIIIDAVETASENTARRAPRRLDTSIDGGVAFVPKGRYSSQAIIRKISQTFGGRRVLQDTNNSENDFEIIDVANPGGWK